MTYCKTALSRLLRCVGPTESASRDRNPGSAGREIDRAQDSKLPVPKVEKFRNSPHFCWLNLLSPWLLISCSLCCTQVGQTADENSGPPDSKRTSQLQKAGNNQPEQPLVEPTYIERGDDWTRFLGPNGNGHSSETGVDPSLWQPHPPVVWTLPLGVSYGAPSLVGKRLYQFDRYGNNERLTCYDVISKAPLWQWQAHVQYEDMYGYNNGPRCSPIIDGDLIFLYGVAGNLYCLDGNTRELVWKVDTFRQYGVVPNFFGVASNPVVYRDKLLVMVGGSPAESQILPAGRLNLVKPNGSAVVAFDKRTGQERYRLGDDLASYASMTVQEVNGNPTGLALMRNGLLAWNPDTGEMLTEFAWRAEMLESVNAAVPITDGNNVMISEAYEIGSAMLDATQTPWSVLWRDSGPRSRCRFRAHWATPVLVDGYLYGCSGRNAPDSDFRCIRWSDGAVQWNQRQHERSSVLAIDGYLLVLGEYGRLMLLRPNSKQIEVVAECDLSQVRTEDGQPLLEYPCWAAPVVSHGLMYLRGKDRLVCFQLIAK